MSTKILTLVIIEQEGQVLLGMKKRGFGAGRWNGFGGKVQDGETIEEAAKREALEECGLVVEKLEKRGELTFEFQGNPELHEVHIFKAIKWTGQWCETEEMQPKWFTFAQIPYNDMWPDDKYWFPIFLEGNTFRGNFTFGEGDTILRQDLQINL